MVRKDKNATYSCEYVNNIKKEKLYLMLCLYVDFKTTATPHTLSQNSPTNRYFVHAQYADAGACYHTSQETKC